MPRRVFVLSPLEDKPVLVDFESRVLTAIACRFLRRAPAERPAGMVRFTEMLPGPQDCWLADSEGNRYTSELRVVAVDSTGARQRSPDACCRSASRRRRRSRGNR